MADIVIIGAGLTGLSTALHLEQRGFTNYKLFEKESEVGGLCRSVHQDGFTFDYTGHLLHVKDDYFRKLITELVGMDNLNSIFRRSFIYSHDTYTNYPYQVNLHGLPTKVIVECIEGYAQRPQHKIKPITFQEWVLDNFGTGIAKHFFFPFQSKIFSFDLKKISPTWMGRFVPKTSLGQMIEGAIKPAVVDESCQKVGYNAHFFYPKQGGIQFWIEKLANNIKQKIHTDFEVTAIDVKQKVVSFSNGHTESYDTLITSMPLDHLLRSLKESSRTRLKPAADNLDCNSVINLNWGVAREQLSERHWIYYPEHQYPFYRIGFPHNFAASMAPEGCSSLYAEFSHVGKTQRYVNNKLTATREQIKKLFKLSDNEVITEKVITIPRAYVMYTHWREKNLPKLLKRLEEQSIYSVGRYGAWKYSSMQEAVLDGKEIVEKVTIMPAQKTFYQTVPLQKEPQKELQ